MSLSPSIRVLVVDDEDYQRQLLADIVAALGFAVATARDGQEAMELQANSPADVIVTDLMMPKVDGLGLLRGLQAVGDTTPAIVLTAFGNIERAISIVHDLKAFWFLEKPVQPSVLRALVERAATQTRLIAETSLLQRQLSHQGVLGDLVGSSPAMRQVYSLISQVAPTSASVLITGESGTGKELVARALHRMSTRSGGPFIAINCAALPESLIESELFGHEKGAFTGAVERHAGCFEQAHGGTVFLDEIGDMPIGTQAKLLRVLEESTIRRLGGKNELPVEVRIIAATNREPEQAIANKHLREDLYYRLSVFHIALPPLRERKEDIPAICDALLANLNRKHDTRVAGLDPEVMARFQRSSWQGNVRQLRNLLERAVIVAGEGVIASRHLPPEEPAVLIPTEVRIGDEGSIVIRAGSQMHEIEQQYIDLVLKHTKNNRTKAAEILGISLRTLQNRLREVNAKSAIAR
jgi:DNA-binding NtrC family response regulator